MALKSIGRRTEDLVSRAFEKCHGAFLSVALVSCVINLLMLTGPLFMLQIYDRVLHSRSVPTLLTLAGLALGLFCFYGLFELIRTRILVRTGRRVEEELREASFDKIIDRKVAQDKKFGIQPIKDLAVLRKYMSGPGLTAMFDMPWAPLYLFVIYMMHPVLGVTATVAVAILFVVALLNHGYTRKPLARANDSSRGAMAVAEENRRNAELVRVLGMRRAMRNRWLDREGSAVGQHTKGMDLSSVNVASTRSLRFMFQSGILALGAWLAIKQEISPGTIIAASIIMARALAPVEQSVSQWPHFLSFRDAYGRLKSVFADDVESTMPLDLPDPEGQLSVLGLSAFAPQSGEILLNNLSFKLDPGDVLGVIGPTGAGKSTLVRSIVGVWPHQRGDVRLDGATMSQWDAEVLGRHIGYLPQDIALFDGTIAENISRFYPDATSQAVIEATKLADIHNMVLKLPDGYRTRIGEEGSVLSAGQRQRLALARAIFGNPRLLIMDEPNSNLDNEGEAALVNVIRELKARGTTIVVVAHRPSAISAADLVLVLVEGRQIAFGPRDEVLKNYMRPVKPITERERNVPQIQQRQSDG